MGNGLMKKAFIVCSLLFALCSSAHAFAPGILGGGGKAIVTYQVVANGDNCTVSDVLTVSGGSGGQITVTANAGFHCSDAGLACQLSSSYCEVTCLGTWQAGTGVSASTLLSGGAYYVVGADYAATGGTCTGVYIRPLTVK